MVRCAVAFSLLAWQTLGDNPCGSGTSECDDSPGDFGECCIDQSTYCVAPRGGFDTSTCCPRWTIGCEVGTVGCCDPATPWQLVTIPGANTRIPWNRTQAREPSVRFEKADASAQALAYALFTEAFQGRLSAATIDASSGELLSHRDVTGPAGDWYNLYFGASTRILPWDPVSARFVFADTDYSSGKVLVYTIDPTTGQSTSQPVSGVDSNPVGMAWDAELRALVLSTHTNGEANFFAVDPDAGTVRSLGRVQRGKDEYSSESFYAAYMSHVHAGVAFRSGLKQVYAGDYEGLGITELPGSSDEGSSAWQDPTKADGHGLPVSMQRHPAGGFLSLAARDDGKLDIVSWAANGTAQTLVQLGNASLPSTPGTGPLGYVADAPVVGDTYATMTVTIAPGTLGVGDKWTLSMFSLSSGEVSEFAIDPQPSILGAETVSLSGFGLPQTQQSMSV